MAYVHEICQPLIDSLNHFSSLPRHKLAGHAANVQFWASEAGHCLVVIDGYQARFQALRQAERDYVRRNRVLDVRSRDVGKGIRPLKRNVKDSELKELRRTVSESIRRFLDRCIREGLITQESVEQFQER